MPTQTTEGGLILAVVYRAAEGRADEVAANLTEMARAVGEHEPGCLAFDVARSPQDPDTFLLYEHYADEAAFETHRGTAHFREIIQERTWPLLASREPARYRFVAGARPPGGGQPR